MNYSHEVNKKNQKSIVDLEGIEPEGIEPSELWKVYWTFGPERVKMNLYATLPKLPLSPGLLLSG